VNTAFQSGQTCVFWSEAEPDHPDLLATLLDYHTIDDPRGGTRRRALTNTVGGTRVVAISSDEEPSPVVRRFVGAINTALDVGYRLHHPRSGSHSPSSAGGSPSPVSPFSSHRPELLVVEDTSTLGRSELDNTALAELSAAHVRVEIDGRPAHIGELANTFHGAELPDSSAELPGNTPQYELDVEPPHKDD
jgi:hypothetical protein